MKKVFAILATIILTVLLTVPVNAGSWYEVSFTGADIWTYSADNATQAPTDQSAPRRYSTFDPSGTGPRVIQDTTYGVSGGTASTAPNLGFSAWAPASGFAFDSINLWGKDDAAAAAWGEKYVSVAGVSSWLVVQAPTGWTSGIVDENQPYNPGPGAFPVWRSGTGAALGIANMTDPNFVFTFDVLIANPFTAFDTDGKLRVFFGGYSDDLQGAGPGNYEVSGVMRLDATPVPIPPSALLLGSGLLGLVGLGWRRRKTNA